MQIIFKPLLFLALIELIYAIEQLVVQEFTSKTFTSSDITNWTQNPVHTCANTIFQEFSNSSVFGIFGKTISNTKKTVNSLPPHWSASIRFDMLLYQSLDGNDYVNIEADTQPIQTFKKNYATDGGQLCGLNYGDILIMYNRNFTHTASSLMLNINAVMDEVEVNEGFVLKNLFIYVDTCDQSCATCNGPNSDQCLTCPSNASKSGNTCTCITNYYSHQFTCVNACPTGFVPDLKNKICVIDFCATSDCQTCVNKICTVCKNGKKLLQGQCVSSCPSYAPETSGVCKDILNNLINGKYLIKGLFSDSFGESEVTGLGFNTDGFLGTTYSTQSGAKVTRCNDKNLLGGAYLSAVGSSVQRQYNIQDPHWQVVIGYTLYKIDSWDYERVDINIDGVVQQQTQLVIAERSSSICGVSTYYDEIAQVQSKFTHSASTMNLKLTTTLDQNPYDESYGIREFFILVDYCTSNCSSCNASGCLSCNIGYYLYQNVCFSTCPSGSYQNSSTTCAQCDSSCKECTSPGTNKNCTQCNSGTYLNPDKSCQSTCPTSYWQRASDLTCQPCDSSCYNCMSPGNANSCLSCSGSLYLLNNQCVSQCGTSYVKVSATNNNTCQKCHSSCLTCDGINSNNCLTCQGPSLFWQPSTKTCVSSCNPNQYQNTINQQCSSCDTSCSTCSGGLNNNCLSCTGNLFLNSQTNKCVATCPDTFFNNTTNNKCTSCESTCATCNGGSANQCLSCNLPRYFQSVAKQCVTTCNTNQYKDDSSKSCKNCNLTCNTCSGENENNCLTCSGNLYLDKSSNKCVSQCPTNQYPNSSNNECTLCESSCATCDGGSNNNCLSCNLPRYYQQSKKQCVTLCNPDQYKDDGSIQCKGCDSSCATCSGGSNNNCLSCSGLLFLDTALNQCVPNCPDSFFNNTANNKCTKCESTCATCNGDSSNSCLTCNLPRFYQSSTKQCVTECKSNQYQDKVAKQCKDCHSTCKSCSNGNANNCLSCSGSLFLDKLTNTCVPKCPNNYYPNSSNNECGICHSTCTTCNGGSESNCLTCSGDRFFQKSTKQCVLECNKNQYKDKSSQECNSCDISCSTCDGASKNQCLSCSETLFLDKPNKQCVSTCPNGFYANKTNNECSKCDQTCQTCDNGTSKDCLSCDGNRFHVKQSKECVEQCPISFYGEENPVRQCMGCHYKCRTGCYGPDAEECDNIKVQYQMLFYILSFKSGLWVFCFVWGIFKDRKIDRFLAVVKPDSPVLAQDSPVLAGDSPVLEGDSKNLEKVDNQRIETKKIQKKVSIEEEIKENQENKDGTFNNIELFSKQQTMINLNLNQTNVNECQPENLQVKNSNDIESKVNIDGTINNIDLYSKQQTMTNLNQNNGFGVEPASRRKFRRMRSHKLTQDTGRSNTMIFDSPALLTLNPLKKMSSDLESDQAIQLPDTQQKSTTLITRNNLMMSSIFSQKSQENVKIKSKQILQNTMLGNEWISLFKFNDPFVSRANRATLIFLKYQAFFFTTQYIYEYSVKYIALCLLIGWSVKFVLSKFLCLAASSSSKFGNIAINLIFQGLLFCHFFFWFVPQLMSLFIEKDKQWSIFYSVIFSVDLLVFQQIFSFFEYILTIKYLAIKNKMSFKAKLLNFFKNDLIINNLQK